MHARWHTQAAHSHHICWTHSVHRLHAGNTTLSDSTHYFVLTMPGGRCSLQHGTASHSGHCPECLTSSLQMPLALEPVEHGAVQHGSSFSGHPARHHSQLPQRNCFQSLCLQQSGGHNGLAAVCAATLTTWQLSMCSTHVPHMITTSCTSCGAYTSLRQYLISH